MADPAAEQRPKPPAPRGTVLVFADYYKPGYAAGGPIRSLSALVSALGSDFRFRIVARDRDLGDRVPYDGVPRGRWSCPEGADVLYLSEAEYGIATVRRLLRDESYDLVYLNSLFSLRATLQVLLLRRLRQVPRKPVLLAPRGELYAGALRQKGLKKRLFLLGARVFGIYHGIEWHACSSEEAGQIEEHSLAGSDCRPAVLPNLVPDPWAGGSSLERGEPKQPGKARLLILGRIARKKNVAYALSLLRDLKGDVECRIYGPITEPRYWRECQSVIGSLPAGVDVRYMGSVPNDRVPELFCGSDLLLFPTLGENFAHVIAEALLSGCPVLLSDQTPWRGLEEARAGWSLPLGERDLFLRTLRECVAMDEREHRRWREGARRHALAVLSQSARVAEYRRLFGGLVEGTRGR